MLFAVSVRAAEEAAREGGVWLTRVASGQEADDYIGEAAVARQAARMMLEVTHACKRAARGWRAVGCECGWWWRCQVQGAHAGRACGSVGRRVSKAAGWPARLISTLGTFATLPRPRIPSLLAAPRSCVAPASPARCCRPPAAATRRAALPALAALAALAAHVLTPPPGCAAGAPFHGPCVRGLQGGGFAAGSAPAVVG